MKDLKSLALHCGAYKAEFLRQDQVVLNREFRKLCEQNSCGNYGKTYMCPPDIGSIDDLMEKLHNYDKALLYQTVAQLEDSFDYEGMVEGGEHHAEVSQNIQKELLAMQGQFLHLAGGGCLLCERCAKEEQLPCRYPERALGSLSAYGVDVSGTTKATTMQYINGQNTVTYFGLILWKEATLRIWKDGHCDEVSFVPPARLSTLLQQMQPCGGRGVCGKCAVTVTGAVSAPNEAEQKAGTRLSCQAVLLGDAQVFLPQTAEAAIETATTGIAVGTPMAGRVGAALDIGTTTMVLRRYDLTSGQLLGQAAMVNPQVCVAADVMGRIDAAIHGRLAELSGQLQNAVSVLLSQAGGQADTMVITGNTTMLYLLTGKDPSALSHAPFEADTLFDTMWQNAYLPPCLHGFVGADITCAVLASGMCQKNETALLCDIGTNGEIALWKGGTLYVASTAAGPAFEGAGISCGCSGKIGAIDRVWEENGALQVHTIGDVQAVGLCGSGLIDAVAVLLATGQLDETGALEDDIVLAPGVTLLQTDIRAVQLAKAAIAAGIETLLETSGTVCEEITTFYLAGGFGSHVDGENAAAMGLFPAMLVPKIQVLGNAALAGASQLLLNKDCLREVREISAHSRHLTLSGNRVFNDHYMEKMLFTEEEP